MGSCALFLAFLPRKPIGHILCPVSLASAWYARRFTCRMIGLNRGLASDPAATLGGVKQSGIGREGAHQGLLEYTETKHIAADW